MSQVAPQTRDLFAKLDGEMWLAHRLEQHGVRPFDGSTRTADRKALIRAAIKGRDFQDVVCGAKPGSAKPETYSQAFKRLYGEPL